MNEERVLVENLFFDNDSGSSETSDSDIDYAVINVISSIAQTGRNAIEQYSEITVLRYSEEKFKRHFRVSKLLMNNLSKNFSESQFFLKYLHEKGKQVVEPLKHMEVFLWYAGHSTSYAEVADRFNITASTLFEIITRVNNFFNDIAQEIIKWPSMEEMEKTKKEIIQKKQFPGVIGAIDGTHIRIDKPSKNQESYCNRKQYHSIQVQIICDNKSQIIDAFIGFPGSVHDARVFSCSFIYPQLPQLCKDGHLLGNSAYPCLNWCLTPYKDNGHLTRQQIQYNKVHSSIRIRVEHTNGLLKQRFRQLYHVKLRKIERVVAFVKSCCVLHNLCHVDDKTIFDAEHDPLDLLPKETDVNANSEDINICNEKLQNGFAKRNYIASIL